MPYLHWETSRSREHFAQFIDEVVSSKMDRQLKTEREAKQKRVEMRKGLPKAVQPHKSTKPPRFYQLAFWKALLPCTLNSTDNRINPRPTGQPNSKRCTKDSKGRVLSMAGLVQQFGYPRPLLEMDKNRRVKTESKLGQYLIDAARLYEGMTYYRDQKLLKKYLTSDPPLHPRRTLDQAYYWYVFQNHSL